MRVKGAPQYKRIFNFALSSRAPFFAHIPYAYSVYEGGNIEANRAAYYSAWTRFFARCFFFFFMKRRISISEESKMINEPLSMREGKL